MDKKKSRTGNLYGLKTNIKFSAIFFSVYFRENCATMTTTKRQYFGEKLQKHNILWHKKRPCTTPWGSTRSNVAERGGFEPPVRFHVRTLSKRVP